MNPRAGHPLLNEIRDGCIFCIRCECWKPPEAFATAQKSLRRRHSWCKQCMAAYNRIKNANLTEEQRQALRDRRNVNGAERARAYRLRCPEVGILATIKYRYGLSADQYRAMVEEQGDRCAACGEPRTDEERLHIDHDHSCCPGVRSCGACIRALLCRDCNHILGLAHDDAERLRKIADYIERFQEVLETDSG